MRRMSDHHLLLCRYDPPNAPIQSYLAALSKPNSPSHPLLNPSISLPTRPPPAPNPLSQACVAFLNIITADSNLLPISPDVCDPQSGGISMASNFPHSPRIIASVGWPDG